MVARQNVFRCLLVSMSLAVLALALGVAHARSAPPGAPAGDPTTPVSAAQFQAPISAYLSYSVGQLGLMQTQLSDLQRALGRRDRPAAEAAWRGAFFDYLTLGAVYLEGPVADLNGAIDGTPGGLAGGTRSRRFSGLHRLEYGLWTGASLSSLQPWAGRLARDVSTLRRRLPSVQISPRDYATRAHEILEDAVRDLLSGTDVPWSGQGVLGTAAAVTATTEVIGTLSPLLDAVDEPADIYATLATLRSTLNAIRSAHGGVFPPNAGMTQMQSERLDAAVGGALEALAQVPGVLEIAPPTGTTPSAPGAVVAPTPPVATPPVATPPAATPPGSPGSGGAP